MKYILYPEKQTAVAGSSEDAGYPWSNLIDNDVRKKTGKAAAGVNTVVLTASIAAGSGGLTLHGTNALSAVCVVKNAGGATISSETHDLSTIPVDRFWQTYDHQAGALTATITLTAAAGVTVEAGIFRAGALVEIAGPQYGAGEGEENFDILYEMRNGAFDGKAGEEVRTFDYQIILPRETTLRTLQAIHRHYRPHPFAMLVSDTAGNDNLWCVFGRLMQLAATHDMPIHSQVSLSIREVV